MCWGSLRRPTTQTEMDLTPRWEKLRQSNSSSRTDRRDLRGIHLHQRELLVAGDAGLLGAENHLVELDLDLATQDFHAALTLHGPALELHVRAGRYLERDVAAVRHHVGILSRRLGGGSQLHFTSTAHGGDGQQRAQRRYPNGSNLAHQ